MAPLSVTQRLDFHTTDAEAFKSIIALERYIHAGTLGESLIALVKLRASLSTGAPSASICTLAMHERQG